MITEPLICPQGLTVPELRKLLETWPDNDAETGEPNEVWFMTGDCLSSPVTCVDRLNRSDIVFGNDIESDVVNLSAENMAPIPAMWGGVSIMSVGTDPTLGHAFDFYTDPGIGRPLYYNIRQITPEQTLEEMRKHNDEENNKL